MNPVRSVLAALALMALMFAGCAPAAPSPTAAPPKPTTAPAQPAATTAPKPAEAKPAASPAATTAPAKPAEAKPAASPAAQPAAQPAASPAAKPAASPAAKPEAISVPKPSGNLAFRIAYPSSIGFSHVPMVMTTERLKSQGWGVEDVFFSATEVAAEATAKGEAPLTSAAAVTVLRAMEAGARMVMVGERVANEWTIASTTDIRDCAGLTGKRVAIHSEGSISTTMIRVWINSTCRGTNPNYIIIAGSDNRAIALLNKQIDASPLELSDWIAVNTRQPNTFHLLVNFAQGLPDLANTPITVNTNWAEQNRPVVVAYLAELMKTHRMIAANPKLLEDASKRLLPSVDENALPEIVRAYQAIKGFDVNGGLTPQRVQGTLKFFTDTGDLKAGLTPQNTANFTYLEEAFRIVGRQ
jgi:NitT/TauT family transport system substrate-binding protein